MKNKILISSIFLIVLLFSLSTITAVDTNTTNMNTIEKQTTDTTKSTLNIVSNNDNNELKFNTTKKEIIPKNKEIKTKTSSIKEHGIANTKTLKKNNEVSYYVSTTGSDNNTGSKDNPYKTIQYAIDKTTTNNTYNIFIKSGNYTGVGNTNLTVNGNHKINFIGEGINKTILDGEANYVIDPNPGYVWESSKIWWPYINATGNYGMTITKGNGHISIYNLSIAHMWSPGGSSISAYPHATIDNYGNLSINSVEFHENYAGVGAGVRNNYGATLLVNNSLFEENHKSSSTGNNGIIYNNGTATILNSLFNHNYARWGTILNDNNITMINTTLSNGIGYDGKSGYKYGSGFACNSGGADFYLPGFFLTYNNIINCTFIKNDQSDIYGYQGNIYAYGNKFINSTGIRLIDSQNSNITYNIINNSMEDIVESTISTTLTTGARTYAIDAQITSNNLTIINNTISMDRGTAISIKKGNIINNTIIMYGPSYVIKKAIEVSGSNSTITNNIINEYIELKGNSNIITKNNIETTSNYAISVYNSAINNTIVENNLVSKELIGDYAVYGNNIKNTIINNTPMPNSDDLYVSPIVNEARNGTMDNPTSLTDALERITSTGTIYLFSKNKKYDLLNSVIINETTVKNTKTVRIKGILNNTPVSGNNKTQLFNIKEGFTVILDNLKFINGTSSNGGIIYSEGNLTVTSSIFQDSYADNGGAVFINKSGNLILKNNSFKNISSLNETLIFNSIGNNLLENNTYENCDIKLKKFTITASTSNPNPILVNNTITVNIDNVILENPTYYDSNITNNINYSIYRNDILLDTITTTSYTLNSTIPTNITTYIISNFSKEKSNTLTFNIIYLKAKAITSNTPTTIVFINEDIHITTTLIDEFNQPVTSGVISYYNNTILMGTVEVINGSARLTLNKTSNIGTTEITIKYTDASNIYENHTNKTSLVILDNVYVSSEVTQPASGSIDNPTTLTDALSKIKDEKTIYLLNGIYYINNQITISKNTTNATTFNIIGQKDVTFFGQNKSSMLNITKDFTIKITNITFRNINKEGLYGAIVNMGKLTLINTTFLNNYNEYAEGTALHNYNGTVIIENSSFINNTGKNGGVIFSKGNLSISNTLFTNNSAEYGGIIYSAGYVQRIMLYPGFFIYKVMSGNLTISNTTFNNSIAKEDYGAIYFLGIDLVLENNTFSNIQSKNETIVIKEITNRIMKNNVYINCSINSTIQISSDATNPSPMKVNDTLKFNIDNIKIKNPRNYDDNITSSIKYNIYLNNIKIDTTDYNPNSFNIIPTIHDTVTLYVIPTFTKTKSNTLILDVEIYGLKNTIIKAENTVSYSDENTTINISVTDKLGTLVSDGGIIRIYENNILLGEAPTHNGVAIIKINPLSTGIHNITIKYIGTETGIYNNQTNTSSIFSLGKHVYVSPDVTEIQEGTLSNPTTLNDALSKVGNYGTIHLLYGTNGIYFINEPIYVAYGYLHSTTNNINIIAQNRVIFDGSGNNMRIMSIIYRNVSMTNISFINSRSIVNNGNLTLIDCIFDNNTAEIKNGGAIENNGHLIIINSTFINNKAINGGAISNGGTIETKGKILFKNNVAEQGGAISNNNFGKIDMNGEILFINNTVKGNDNVYAGAIYNLGNITLTGNTLFINNTASGNSIIYGGAIYNKGNITSIGNTTFNNNKVIAVTAGSGGSIYSLSGVLIFEGNNTFNNNEATTNGGAIQLPTSNTKLILNNNTIFSNNKAYESGGAMSIVTALFEINGNITFRNNSADKGGALYLVGSKYIPRKYNIVNAIFLDNKAFIEGGAIYTNYINLTLENNTFTNIISPSETLFLNTTGTNILSNNTYINCSILTTPIILNSNKSPNFLLKINSTIILMLEQFELINPSYYDSNILDNVSYNIYRNDELIKNSDSMIYNLIVDTDRQITTYIIPSILSTKSNILTFKVQSYTNVIIDPVIAQVGDIINLRAQVTDSEGNPVSNGRVIFKVNGKTIRDNNGNIIYVQVINGIAILENYRVPTTWIKSKPVLNAVYGGNNQYITGRTNNTIPMNITKKEVSMTMTTNTTTVKPGQTIKITVKITEKDANVNEGQVLFKVNGKTMRDNKGYIVYHEVKDGLVTITYTIPENARARDYTFTCVYGHKLYNRNDINSTITVVKN